METDSFHRAISLLLVCHSAVWLFMHAKQLVWRAWCPADVLDSLSRTSAATRVNHTSLHLCTLSSYVFFEPWLESSNKNKNTPKTKNLSLHFQEGCLYGYKVMSGLQGCTILPVGPYFAPLCVCMCVSLLCGSKEKRFFTVLKWPSGAGFTW